MKYILIIWSIFLGGCSTVGSDYEALVSPDNQKSVVYIYFSCDKESKEYAEGGTIGTSFYINDKFIGYLAPNSYIPLVLPLGTFEMKFYPTWNYDTLPKLKFDYEIKDTKS